MKYLNTPTIYAQKPSKVDRDKGIIHNIVVVQTGEAKGHNIHLNDKFLDDVVQLSAERPAGIKARFGHPNICATALGTYLGRFKNFRDVNIPPLGGQRGVVADLHLDTSAKKSPKGNLYEYVLDMAENNPDMFGASIAFKKGESFKTVEEIDGKKIKKQFATIKALYATDLVDSPAATDGLFQSFQHDDLASQVTIFLDEHPQVFELLDKKPEILSEFLDKYKKHKTMNFKDDIDKLRKWAKVNLLSQINSEGFDVSEADDSITDMDSLTTTFEDKISALEQKYVSEEMLNLQVQLSTFQANIAGLESELERLTTDNSQLTENNFQLTEDNSQLTTELNQMKANPTVTSKSGDPKLNINPKDKDETGKVLLSELPQHLRKKLKK